MQRDKTKLCKAHWRRIVGQLVLLLAVLSMAPYSFFRGSARYRNYMGFGHYWLLLCVALACLAVIAVTMNLLPSGPFWYALTFSLFR